MRTQGRAGIIIIIIRTGHFQSPAKTILYSVYLCMSFQILVWCCMIKYSVVTTLISLVNNMHADLRKKLDAFHTEVWSQPDHTVQKEVFLFLPYTSKLGEPATPLFSRPHLHEFNCH